MLVLATRLKMDGKVVEEGTPYSKLTKAQKDLAKELNLLEDQPEDNPEEEDDEEEAEETETEDTEAESEG